MAKILLVDDSNLSRRILRRILEPAGYDIIEATDGLTAIERYFLEHPDLVFLDMTMSGMPGIDVLNKLREIDSNARVIVATADIQSSTRAMVRDSGAIGFVAKPFTEENVLYAVEAIFAKDSS